MPATTRSATIQEVAARAGVSRAAVSKVIRNAYGVSPRMRERVQSAVDELGYRPRVSARSMRGSSYTIGIDLPDLNNTFFTQLVNGATSALADTGYQLIIAPAAPGYDLGQRSVEALADRQVDGIIVVSARVSAQWLENLSTQVPLVMLGRHDDSANYDTVVCDDYLGAQLVVRHLYQLGHRRIVHLTENEVVYRLSGFPHAYRLEGYKNTMRELGLSDKIEVARVSETSQEAAARATRDILVNATTPVGIFAAHDVLALGALEAITNLGMDASQASVVGFDDVQIAAHSRISLTSVNQSGMYMGETCIRLLMERISGRTEAVHEVVAPHLMTRGSTSPPRM